MKTRNKNLALSANAACLCIDPRDYGIQGYCRVRIFNNKSEEFELTKEIPNGGKLSIQWAVLESHLDYRFGIQVKLDRKWTNSTEYIDIKNTFKVDNLVVASLASTEGLTIINPIVYGINEMCKINIYDGYCEAFVLKFELCKDQSLMFPNTFLKHLACYSFLIHTEKDGVYVSRLPSPQ